MQSFSFAMLKHYTPVLRSFTAAVLLARNIGVQSFSFAMLKHYTPVLRSDQRERSNLQAPGKEIASSRQGGIRKDGILAAFLGRSVRVLKTFLPKFILDT